MSVCNEPTLEVVISSIKSSEMRIPINLANSLTTIFGTVPTIGSACAERKRVRMRERQRKRERKKERERQREKERKSDRQRGRERQRDTEYENAPKPLKAELD